MNMTFADQLDAAARWPLFEPVIGRLTTDSVQLFGAPTVRLTPVAYHERPFSHLLRVAVSRDRSTAVDRHVYIKIFKPKPDYGLEQMRQRVVHDFDVSRRIFDALCEQTGAAATVRPLACYVDHLAVVSEEAVGATLLAHLEAHARWFPAPGSLRTTTALLEAVGRWLRAFQSIEPGPSRVSLDAVRAYIDVRLQRLVSHAVLTAAERDDLLRHLDVLAARVSNGELREVLIHADLAPGNVLVSGARVIVLDFAMAQRGSELHDLTRLYAQLDVLRAKPQFRSAVVRALQDALLRGFDQTLTPGRPLFRYYVLLHRINHICTLSLSREGLLASALSRRVRRLHRGWIARELNTSLTTHGGVA